MTTEAAAKPVKVRARLLAAANARGIGDGVATVRFILQARAMINELLAILQRSEERGFHSE